MFVENVIKVLISPWSRPMKFVCTESQQKEPVDRDSVCERTLEIMIVWNVTFFVTTLQPWCHVVVVMVLLASQHFHVLSGQF